MTIRFARPEDRGAVLGMVVEQIAETLPHLEFDYQIARMAYDDAMERGAPAILIAERDETPIGFCLMSLHPYLFCSGVMAALDVVFVRPENRGSRAAAELVNGFVRWSRAAGARETYLGISNGHNVERTARFMERASGAQRVGVMLRSVA